jgi:hypothetical protein
MINKLFNILSLGKFNEMKGKLGYDDIFHLYMVVKYDDGTTAIIEKNQDINIDDDINRIYTEGTQKIAVNMSYYPTLGELLENTKQYMGESRFYKYDAFNRKGGGNCQDFIAGVLVGNKLINEQLRNFIIQDTTSILKSLPQYTNTIARVSTDTGSYINRFLQTIGLQGFEDGGLVVV